MLAMLAPKARPQALYAIPDQLRTSTQIRVRNLVRFATS
jgi:hypothetical protein